MPDDLLRVPILPVLRARRASDCLPVITELVAGGMTCIEMTLTTPGVLDLWSTLRHEFGHDVLLGVGTITTDNEIQEVMKRMSTFSSHRPTSRK
ncbi:hypothetical protein [Arthrobacter tecti]